MSQYGQVILSSLEFTASSETSGIVNGIINLEVLLLDNQNNPVENAPIYFHWVSGDFHGLDREIFSYDNDLYALTDVDGKAKTQMKVVNTGKTVINAAVNEPVELISSTTTLTISDEETEIYITNFTYFGSAWQDNINGTFDYIDTVFRDIENFSFYDLAISHAEVVNSNLQTRNEAVLFIKRATYNGKSYLSDSESSSMRTAIISRLSSEINIGYSDIEIRSSRKTPK